MASHTSIATKNLIDLLKSADPSGKMQVTITNQDQLAVGLNPFTPTILIDFGTELLRPAEEPDALLAAVLNSGAKSRTSRQSGRYILEFKGTMTECGSLKNLLAEGLMALEKCQPGMLEKLSAIKPRTKRIVARNPEDLFDRVDQSAEYSEPLMDGWWYGTNNSAEETRTWLTRGAEIAGLKWDKDISISF